jgi:hypothetical protein
MGFLNCYDISMLTYGKIPLIGPIFEYSPINYSDLLLARGAYCLEAELPTNGTNMIVLDLAHT